MPLPGKSAIRRVTSAIIVKCVLSITRDDTAEFCILPTLKDDEGVRSEFVEGSSEVKFGEEYCIDLCIE